MPCILHVWRSVSNWMGEPRNGHRKTSNIPFFYIFMITDNHMNYCPISLWFLRHFSSVIVLAMALWVIQYIWLNHSHHIQFTFTRMSNKITKNNTESKTEVKANEHMNARNIFIVHIFTHSLNEVIVDKEGNAIINLRCYHFNTWFSWIVLYTVHTRMPTFVRNIYNFWSINGTGDTIALITYLKASELTWVRNVNGRRRMAYAACYYTKLLS